MNEYALLKPIRSADKQHMSSQAHIYNTLSKYSGFKLPHGFLPLP